MNYTNNKSYATWTQVLSGIAALVILSATTCYGATVQSTTNYGQMRGTHVTYMDVLESTFTEAPASEDTATDIGDVITKTALAVTDVIDPSTLYGSPTIAGNSLDFMNPNFFARADGTNTTDLTDGRLSFALQADASMYINCLTLDEFGAISLTSPAGTANSGTLVRVQAPAFLTVYEVMLDNGEIYTLPSPTGERLTAEMVVTPDESSDAGGWHSADPDVGSIWEGQTTFNITQMLSANGISGPAGRSIMGATRVEYDMNNILTAQANDGKSTAFIDKKGITITPKMTAMITPEPSTALLTIPCLLALASGLRRRK